MRCPDEGMLFMYLDGELSDEAVKELEDHLQECILCRRHLSEMRQDYSFSMNKLAGLRDVEAGIPTSGQDEVWNKIQEETMMKSKGVTFMKIRKAAIAAALVLALGAVGSMPAVQAAASSLLQVFRVEQVDTLSLTPGDMRDIEQNIMQGEGELDIDEFGTIKTTGEAEVRDISDEDIETLGFDVKFPAVVNGDLLNMYLQEVPDIEISPEVESVNGCLQMMGSSYQLPAVLDGQTCTFSMGDSLYLDYSGFSLMQTLSPQIEVPAGVSVQEVADAMVDLPIWPDQVRRQLEGVSDWEHTLLIPGEGAEKVDVNGQTAVLISQPYQEVLIWQEDGMLYSLESQEPGTIDLITVAESLR
ncbi:MAG: zf-HC2 domain-containing protein [Bacillota bacterium]|nr:zf-HC2 domain-containing protein [Bacillota bacterium]